MCRACVVHAILILTPSCVNAIAARPGGHIRMYRYTGLVSWFSNYNHWL